MPLDDRRQETTENSPAAVAEHATPRSWRRKSAASGRLVMANFVDFAEEATFPDGDDAIGGEALATAALGAAAALALLLPLPLPREMTHAERVLARAEAIIIRGERRKEKERKTGKEFFFSFFFEIE